MSAPDTNVERQARRHKGPLLGILAAVCIATAGFLALLVYTADEGGDPAPATVQGPAGTATEPPAGN